MHIRLIPESRWNTDEQALSELGQYMGVPVRFFVAQRDFRGFHADGITYVNRNGGRGIEWAFWHENLHWMKQQDPALYRDLLTDVQESGAISSEQIAQYRQTIAQGDTLTDTEVVEEMLSDEFADTAKRQAWLQQLQQRDTGLFERFIDWIKSVIARMKAQVGEYSKLTEQQVKAFENAARRTLLSMKDASGNRLFHDRTEFPYQELPAESVQFSSGNVQEPFAKQLDDWARGIKRDTPIVIGNTPDVLVKLGAKQLPIEISQKVVAKVVNPEGVNGGKHGIDLALLKQLPSQLDNPVMVFKSATVDNGIVVLTELTDSQKRSVIAAIHLEVKHGRHMVNAIASVYGRNNEISFVQDQIDKGRLLYADKEKSRDWFQSRGLQLPKEGFRNHDSINSIVPQSSKDVNGSKPDNSINEKKSTARHRVDNIDPLHTSTSVSTLTPGGGSTSFSESDHARSREALIASGAKTPEHDSVTSMVQQEQKDVKKSSGIKFSRDQNRNIREYTFTPNGQKFARNQEVMRKLEAAGWRKTVEKDGSITYSNADSFGSEKKAVTSVVSSVKKPKKKPTAESIIQAGQDSFDKFYQQLVDELHPLAKLAKIDPEAKKVYEQAWLTRGWVGKAQVLLERGKNGVASFKDIIKPVENNIDEFAEYCAAVRIKDLAQRGIKQPMTEEEADAIIKDAPPEFAKAQKELVQYQQNLLRVLVDGGILSEESYQNLVTKEPNYVPLFKEFDEAAIGNFARQKGFANIANPIKKISDSNRQIINPLESVVKNTYMFINMAERNKVGKSFADLAKLDHMKGLVEEVESGSAKESVFSVWDNGERNHYQTTPEMYRALMMLDKQPADLIVKILRTPAGWLRAGATLSPEFMVRNPVRDATTAYIFSHYGFKPGIDSVRGAWEFVKATKVLNKILPASFIKKHKINDDGLYWEYIDSGAAHSAMVSLDRDYLQNSIAKYTTKTFWEKVAGAPGSAIDVLRAISEVGEMSTRLGEYKRARKQGATPEQAALAARDITLDFSRHGTEGKKINQYAAFINAQVQGIDKAVRVFKEHPDRTMGRIALSITVPSVLLWMINHDDDRYKELPQWQKDLFWIIPTQDYLIRIPKPFELGILFGTSVERFFDWMVTKDSKAFSGLGKSVVGAFIPNMVPTALIPLAEWWANKSWLTGRNIVPQREEKLPPRLQQGPYSSTVAKTAGEMFNVSPRQVDNLLRGYTGGIGKLMSDTIDYIGQETGLSNAPEKPEMRIHEWPVLRGFTATPYKSNQSTQEFYDRLTELEQQYNEMKLTRIKPDGFDGAELQRLRQANKRLSELNKKERSIMDSSLSAEEKRKRLDNLEMFSLRMVKSAMGKK